LPYIASIPKEMGMQKPSAPKTENVFRVQIHCTVVKYLCIAKASEEHIVQPLNTLIMRDYDWDDERCDDGYYDDLDYDCGNDYDVLEDAFEGDADLYWDWLVN